MSTMGGRSRNEVKSSQIQIGIPRQLNSMQTTPKPVTTITKSTTTAMRTETLYPIHPHPLFCITHNTCDSDKDCPGGACKKHSKSGV